MFRSISAHAGLVWSLVAALVAVLGLIPQAEAKAPTTASATEDIRPPMVVVRGLGPVPQDTLRLACRTLLQNLPVRCEIRGARALSDVEHIWDEEREQLDARAGLEAMFRDRAGDALAEINITAADIFEPNKPYVFGLASLTDRIAIVSLARIDDNPRALPRRLAKLVMHETAHTFGLHHHDREDCVMRQDPTVKSLDSASAKPCEACHRKLKRRASKFSRPGQLALDRGRGYLVRGDPAVARQLLLSTVWAGAYNGNVLHDFGVAFREAGQLDDAIGILKFLVQQEPAHARGHANLALAYQARGAKGDLPLAITHFERVVELRPDWTTIAAHLDELQSAPPSAQGP